jgi:hypothetical protein
VTVLVWVLMLGGIGCIFGGIGAPAYSDAWAAWSVCGNGLCIAAMTVLRSWAVAAIFAVFLAVTLWRWWRRRKDRKRAMDAIGAKTRALLATLVRKAREAGTPRPVLRPVPGAA